MNNEQRVQQIAGVIDSKQGRDILALDMRELTTVADYYLITDASNERQVQAIAREVKEQAEKLGITVNRLEGFDKARWILVDLGDIICHVFHQEERSYYNLERLWGDAPLVDLNLSEE